MAFEHDAIREQVELILEGEYFYSFDRLNLQGDYVQDVGMWLVSAESRLLAYVGQEL